MNKYPQKQIGIILLILFLIVFSGPINVQATSIIAYDMVGSASQNLVSYTNPWNGAFSSAGDGFQKYQRFVSPTIPFSVLDDSLSIFPPDSLGIIKEGNLDEFFGVTDTVNSNNSGPVSATWVFDISGATDLSLSIDMGAMGDFESSDTFVWEYQIDGGPVATAFASTVDEAGSFTYTLEGGASFTLSDPMLVDGVILSDDLQTFTTALTGEGANLTLTLTASTNGGTEAFTFQNIVIEGTTGPTVIAYDMVGSASQNLVSYTNPWTGAFSSAGDGFQKYQRFVSPTIPFSVLDDSLSIFPPDSLGIIKEGNLDEFFGVTDTVNSNNSGPVTASWVFDISGATNLSLSIDMGAMGDFESSDTFVWEYQIDGGPVATAFANTVDEAGSFTYTLEGGASFILSDPMLVNGVILSDDLQTFTTDLTGEGVNLTLTLTASTNGGTEAFAFQNIVLLGGGGSGEPPEVCGDPFTPVYDIQGAGFASPLVGTTVSVEGIVVGDFQENDGDHTDLDGFHIQDPVGDGNAATSDGIFVFAPGATDVMVGDAVRVTGIVDEFFGMTEITSVSNLLNCGTGTVAPTLVTIPTDLEPYEGMLVKMDQSLYISEFFNFDRFGEIVLTTDRQYQPTATFDPGSPAATALTIANAANRITLDDGRTSQNPDPAIHPNGNVFDLGNLFRGGDIVNNVTGVIDYRFGLYRVQPTIGADYTPTNPRQATPDPVGGTIQVASFNVLNYFTTIDTGANICGPNEDLGCRGADDVNEFNRQRAKIIAAIVAMNADVVGLIEIENHATDAAVQDLIAGLNDAAGAGTYAYVATGPIGTDAIKVAFIYQPATVSLAGDYAILDSAVDSRFIDAKNRPVLAQTFMENANGAKVTVAVNHLKSKGSPCDDVGDPNTGDGAGNCNLTRLAAAQALVDWLAMDPTGSGDPDFLIIGDLNSYDKEDPIDAILAGADDVLGSGDDYTDLLYQFIGEDAYSYVFNGQLGYLDYGLANADLMGQVTGATAWHINSDEADLIDYDTSFKQDAQDAIYAPDAYRSSDHDPVIVGLYLNAPPVCGTAVPSVETLWPVNHEFVAIEVLGVTDPDGDPITITIDSIFQDEAVDAPGSGHTGPDGQGLGTATAEVRAERVGNGNGRVYHITFTAADDHGNFCSGEILVSVPKSQGKHGAAVDDGALFDSTLLP